MTCCNNCANHGPCETGLPKKENLVSKGAVDNRGNSTMERDEDELESIMDAAMVLMDYAMAQRVFYAPADFAPKRLEPDKLMQIYQEACAKEDADEKENDSPIAYAIKTEEIEALTKTPEEEELYKF